MDRKQYTKYLYLILCGMILGNTEIFSQDKIYWTNDSNGTSNDRIEKMNLDGSSRTTIISGLSTPIQLFVDVANSKVYWSENATTSKKIRRCNLDGSSPQDVISLTNAPYGVAVDPGNNMLYWSETTKVRRVSISSIPALESSASDVATGLGTAMRQIAIHYREGKIYWADNTNSNKKIQRRNIDGSGSVEDIINNGGIGQIEDLALDSINNYIYWADRASWRNQIRRVSSSATFPVDTGSQTVVRSSGSAEAMRSVAVNPVNNDIFWGYSTNCAIRRGGLGTIPISSDTSAIASSAIFSLFDIFLAIASPTVTTHPSNQTICTGSSASFTVVDSNAATYQWQEFTSSWANISNGGVYSGATTATLNISNVAGLNGRQYRVYMRGATPPAVTSNAATLTVISAPSAPTASAATSVMLNSFTANWSSVSGATGYLLDVSTGSGFSSFVSGYNGLSVAGTSQSVTGLSVNTTYYYRVRAVNSCGNSSNSSTITQTTASSATLTFTCGSNVGLNYTQEACAVPSNNCAVGQFSISSNLGGATLNQVVITITGTYSGLSGSTPFRMYASNTNSFSSAVAIGSDAGISGGTVTFSSIGDILPTGNRYYWLTVDITLNANGTIKGNINSSASLSAANAIFSGGNFGDLHAGSDVPLPVELTEQKAFINNGKAFIEWTTASEHNNAGFEIERKTAKSQKFVKISSYLENSSLIGFGNTAIGKKYNFCDENIDHITGNELVYYKLVSIDFGGERHEHPPVTLKLSDNSGKNSFLKKFSSDPQTRNFHLEIFLEGPARILIDVYSILGEKVVTIINDNSLHAGQYDFIIPASEFPVGAYLIMLRAGDYTEVRQFTVLH